MPVTITTIGILDVEKQDGDEKTETVKVPDVVTVMLWVVALLLHKYVYPDGALRTTLPPVQKVVAPDAVIAGIGGAGVLVTVVTADDAVHPAKLVTVTRYVPAKNV